LGQVVGPHGVVVHLPISYQQIFVSLHPTSEPFPVSGNFATEAVKQHQHEATDECRHKRCRTIDGAREHRRQNEAENCVERGHFRQEAFVRAAKHHDSGDEDDGASERDL
jgi:hypothetical protein